MIYRGRRDWCVLTQFSRTGWARTYTLAGEVALTNPSTSSERFRHVSFIRYGRLWQTLQGISKTQIWIHQAQTLKRILHSKQNSTLAQQQNTLPCVRTAFWSLVSLSWKTDPPGTRKNEKVHTRCIHAVACLETFSHTATHLLLRTIKLCLHFLPNTS